jgi:EAL and modified HD-GYP domain-containing signal transduction protein
MNDTGCTTPDNAVTLSVARQPVFDAKRRLWGYDLFCVGRDPASPAGVPTDDRVAIGVASSAYMGLQQIISGGQKIILNFSEKSILEQLPYAMPPALAVVQVTEQVFAQPHVLPVLQQFKTDGFQIGVADFSGAAASLVLYEMADVISLDVSHTPPSSLEALVAKTGPFPGLLMARNVGDSDQLALCRDLGFKLFQGAFFKLPDTVEMRTLTSNEVARFKLLHLLEGPEDDFNQLAETIQSDITISFRLLAYLNSAAFGLRQKIKSINQAIAMLGWRKIKNWLRVVLLNDMGRSRETPELMRVATQRGKFLELIAKAHDYWGFDPESLHLLGIFSLLDTMLGVPMTDIVAYLPLDDKLKAALCGEPNNEYLPLLELARHVEEARWEACEKMMQQLNLNSDKVKAALQEAIDWADEVSSLQAGEPAAA